MARLGFAAPPRQGSYRLAYDGPASCPDALQFEREVANRTPRASRVASDPTAPTLVVTLQLESHASSGVLDIRASDGTRSVRSVEAPTCQEVVAGLALVAALALDPEASVVAEAAPAHNARTIAADAGPGSTPTAQTGERDALGPVERDFVDGQALRASPVAAHRWTVGVGVDGVAQSGIAPFGMYGGALFVSVARGPLWKGRLGGTLFAEREGSTWAGQASFALWTLRAEACGAPWSSLYLRLDGCVGIDGGRHRVEGAFGALIATPRTASTVWIAPVALVRAGFSMGALTLEIQAELLFPLWRERFLVQVAPDSTVEAFRANAVAGAARIGVVYHFAL